MSALVVMVIEMSIAEFIAVQRLSDRGRRHRFGLPQSCTPKLTATRGVTGRVVVVVTCEDSDEPEWTVRASAAASRFHARRPGTEAQADSLSPERHAGA